MAIATEINDAFKRAFGREATGDEISRGSGLSVGQLNDQAELRRLSGQETTADIAARSLQMAREANAPAVQTLQSTIPTTQSAFQAETQRLQASKEPLQKRYDNLIQQIAQRQTTAENRQTVVTKNELAKRGINTQTGMGAQELVNAVNPITQEYSGLLANTGSDRESALSNIDALISQTGLNREQTLNTINQAIAQLQAGAGAQGLQLAQGEISNNLQQTQAKVANELAKQELALKQASMQGLGDNQIVNVGGTGYVINPQTGQIVSSFGGSGSGGGVADTDFIVGLQDLAKQFGG